MQARNIIRGGKDIADYSVRNPQGEDLGTIKDVVIDTSEGCIAYAALSFGGDPGARRQTLRRPPLGGPAVQRDRRHLRP
ncbi:PRC-barrel domain-containing protein [Methanoculleus chikugoensis]|uniref:PRC-barrel domain-containing protein n=1 Tax=Methanoculleus chikugoensis TaxID=118126 RepID=UPI001FB53A2F|nr:PRC-barrel domain-containing protein [Methanoculleus chikugoensis]